MPRQPKKKTTEPEALDQHYTSDGLARLLVGILADNHELANLATVVEPSAGGGAFVRALAETHLKGKIVAIDVDPNAAGLRETSAIDIVDDFLSFAAGVDGFTDGLGVVGNPPFSGKHKCGEPHVRAALRLAFGEGLKPTPGCGGLVGMLLPTDFICAQGRAKWIKGNPPQIYFLYPRPKFHGPADKGFGGQQNISFLVWSARPPGPPVWVNIDGL